MTYNKLTNSSILCITAKDRSTMRQMVVKALFFQMEFGIRAGFCILSCLPHQKMNAGTRARLKLSSAALAGSRMYAMSDVIILYCKGTLVPMIGTLPGATYARTYENKAKQVLAMAAPTQSMPVANLWRVGFSDSLS